VFVVFTPDVSLVAKIVVRANRFVGSNNFAASFDLLNRD
jgi:hypothetical protein